MKDLKFKEYSHIIPKGFKVFSNGTKIGENYHPDLSICNTSNKVKIIIESENKSDRKAFLGAILGAIKFASEISENLELIFVLKEYGNQTTIKQLYNYIAPYYKWLKTKFDCRLNNILLITDKEYIASNTNEEEILSDRFINRCKKL